MIRDPIHVIWLVLCIMAHAARGQFPMRPMTRVWHKSQCIRDMRELRAIYQRHGIKL